MRFIVDRTSVWDDEVQPCDGTYQYPVDTHVYYTFKTLAEAERKHPDKQFEKVGGRIRTTKREQMKWCIDIDTMPELMAFVDKHAEVIISRYWENPDFIELEIYDDYRE